jgi:hypothetical protein
MLAPPAWIKKVSTSAQMNHLLIPSPLKCKRPTSRTR